jgi:hypothetical protein
VRFDGFFVVTNIFFVKLIIRIIFARIFEFGGSRPAGLAVTPCQLDLLCVEKKDIFSGK